MQRSYYYVARWYDPSIMQFQQPDTLVPDPYNPLDWNRYTYARFNPVKYTDPSGHFACGDGIDDPRCDQFDPPTITSPIEGTPTNPILYLLSQENVITEWVYENIPTVVGNHVGVNGQAGMNLEGGGFADVGYAFNWVTGELSVVQNYGVYGYLGSWSMLEADGYFGATYTYNATSNESLRGISVIDGASLQADPSWNAGISLTRSHAIEDASQIPFKPYLDPVSNRQIVTKQIDIVGGWNAIPNGIDIGAITGFSYTSVNTVHVLFPWSLFQ